MTHQILKIKTAGQENDCQCITHVLTDIEGILSIPEVIEKIRQQHDFVVKDRFDGSSIEVKPIPKDKPTYIRTEANDTPNDNLLNLPRF